MSSAVTTTDHEAIRSWVEARGGRPARVRRKGPGGILRIDFGAPDEDLESIDWDRFFAIFEENWLVFLHQDSINGDTSRFSKFVERNRRQ